MTDTGVRKSALVTGGAGFIGSHVARALREEGLGVVVLDDLSGGFVDNVPRGVELVEGSILDVPLMTRFFQQYGFDAVYHLAAYAAEGLSPFIRRFNYQNNLIGSINLINLAVEHEVSRFVFTSSIAVYGTGPLPLSEDQPPAPEDPYGIAKAAVERDLACAHETFGLDYTIFRPHNVYGEHQNIGDRYRNVVGIFINQLMQGKPFTVFGDGEQTRAFTYIGDVVTPMVRCLDLPATIGEVFNLGADQPHTVNELAAALMKCMETESAIEYLPVRGEQRHAYSDHSKLRRFFPDLPDPTPLETGLARKDEWARAVGPRTTKLFSEVELTQNMPPSWEAELRAAGLLEK